MKKNKNLKSTATKTLAELYQTLNEIQREEMEMTDTTSSYSHLNSLYQHFALLQSKMTTEVGPHRTRLLLTPHNKAFKG